MSKTMLLTAAAVVAGLVSGCTLVGRHAAPVEGGSKTTVGLFAFESIGNGYPMIPVYSSFEQGK